MTHYHEYHYLENIKTTLGRKAHGQFRRAIKKPMTRFAREMARNLISGDIYYPVSDRQNRPGRNHLATVKIAEGRMMLEENCYFANPLTIAEAEYGADGKAQYPAPMSRTRIGKYQVYTFEFDYADVAFFELQLGWLRSSGKKSTDCAIGRFFKACTQWADFRGITVNWSGHKSLHIHVIFEMSAYIEKFGEPDAGLREGLIEHWNDLETMLLQHLDLTETMYLPDRQLRFPEQYRRLPHGWRTVDDDHFLGIAAGTRVCQTTLWEMWLSRAAKGKSALFHQPTRFVARAADPGRANDVQRRATSMSAGDYSAEQIAYFEARLREFYPEGAAPEFSHLARSSGSWCAHFRNSSNDQTPSSIIREGYCSMLIQGKNSQGLVATALPASLGEMMERWAVEMTAGATAVIEADGPDLKARRGIEKAFAEARTIEDARAVLDRHLPMAVHCNPLLLVVGPEGSGKTSAMLRHHPQIASRLETDAINDRVNPRRALYVFASYEAAREKCNAFNRIHEGSGHIGMVLPSFSEAYRQACETLACAAISKVTAAKEGYPSQWAAIESRQPEVIAEFQRRHAEFWERIGDREPVLFSVHQVARDWHRSTPSRLMWAPSFWTASPNDRTDICRAETRISLLVHDEVSRETFVTAVPGNMHDWIEGLKATTTGAWRDSTLRERFRAYSAYTARHPVPDGMGFDRIDELAHLNFNDRVITTNSAEYGDCAGKDNIYAACHDNEWYIARRGSWSDVGAQRVVLLTTEAVPTIVAQRAEPELAVVHLDAVAVPRNAVDVHPRQNVRGNKLVALIKAWRRANSGNWFAISNRLAGMEDATNHALARGSNEMIGRDIVQTMTYLTPQEYQELQALNAWCERNDLIRLRHLDEFNQTAGRNMGFRHRNGVKHALLISHRLLDLLLPALGWSRYDWTIHLTADQRQTITRKKSPAENDNVVTISTPGASGAVEHVGSETEGMTATYTIDLRKRA